MALNIEDVRAEMPNYEVYKDWQRQGEILGIAVHHSATANRATGAPTGDAHTFFNYHVNTLGWAHGGYNYIIKGDGQIEYALDEKISAYHAGFRDPDDVDGLERGQYWNNHYLAICLSGWFSENRTYRDADGRTQTIPNAYTTLTEAQNQSLLTLIQHLRQKYDIPVENVRGHRELAGNSTTCPGHNLDPAELRTKLRQVQTTPPAEPGTQPEVGPGEHVLLLPDADQYLNAAMAYIWKFQPDVSFSVGEARGRWEYITVVGDKEDIGDHELNRLRDGGAKLVERITGQPDVAQATLDELVRTKHRFLIGDNGSIPGPTPEPPPQEWQTYTVQPGDTLSLIAKQMYSAAHLWRVIFEANADTLSDPGQIRPGQTLKIPPRPA